MGDSSYSETALDGYTGVPYAEAMKRSCMFLL